ncbi:uncharacterized protein LOC131623441 [Vicia villosa]|uniref:uncharacterized protein LOC131623441 n=1 Tax=Vicia villosa TaxID=3911 RepID=UPI00273A8B93|nr:uncharacterized protein LOC131623441 [Vicia villosa]
MDNTDEELLKSMLKKEHQYGSSSREKRRTVIDQSREEWHNHLFNDYFSKNPVYIDVQFRRRFRMHRHVFLRIVVVLGNHDEYFQMRVDATGKMGLSPLQKCTCTIRMLAYGSPADSVDEYVRIGESTSIECLERFVRGVNVLVYLGEPPVQYSALVLLSYIALHVPDSEELARVEVLGVLEWASKQLNVTQDETVTMLLQESKSRLELYQSRGSRGFQKLHQ